MYHSVPSPVFLLLQIFSQFFYFAPVIFKSDQNLFVFHEKELRACKNKRWYNRCTCLLFKFFLLFRLILDIDFFIRYMILRKKLLRFLAICSHWPGEKG